MSQQGYLVIADITGYTAYLSQSELEHAQDSLGSLLSLLVEHTKAPLVISRLEGDAVISYAPEGSFIQGQTLVETIERTYVDFRRAREQMIVNTTCECNACTNIPNLDLKFFVHYGAFVLQQIGAYTEMAGNDVNLIHRLTKNTVTEKTGLFAYALYTQAAADALEIGEMCAAMTRQVESYEHLGEVVIYVQDLHAVWKRDKEKLHVAVDPEDALFNIEFDFPVGQALMWDYVTKPEYRTILNSADSQTLTDRSSGRTAAGAVYHCAHGKSVTTQTIVDWHPFEQLTSENTTPLPGTTMLSTLRLKPIESGTRLSGSWGRARGRLLNRIVCNVGARVFLPRAIRKGCQALHDQIVREIAEGKVVQLEPGATEVAAEDIREAAAEGLTASTPRDLDSVSR